jgi:hypothetical protein
MLRCNSIKKIKKKFDSNESYFFIASIHLQNKMTSQVADSNTSVTHEILGLVDNVKKKLTDKQYKDIVDLLQKQNKLESVKSYQFTACIPTICVDKCDYDIEEWDRDVKFVCHQVTFPILLDDDEVKKFKEIMHINIHAGHFISTVKPFRKRLKPLEDFVDNHREGTNKALNTVNGFVYASASCMITNLFKTVINP